MKEQINGQRILICCHTTNMGGAERALLYLTDRILRLGYQIHFAVPSERGPFIAALETRGLHFTVCEMSWILPDFSQGSISHTNRDFHSERARFQEQKFDLVLTNTCVIVFGALLASAMGVPHVFYIHEVLKGEPDLACSIVDSSYLTEMLSQLSSGMLFCSAHALKSFRVPESLHSAVVYPVQPFSSYSAGSAVPHASAKRVDLLLVGFQNRRKNMAFSLDVLMSLRIRGWNARVHIIGHAASASEQLKRAISARGLSEHVVIHGYREDVFNNKWECPIHLVCSLDEPFGLTVIEAVCAGIPVVSSASGGPEEIIDRDFVYQHGDLDSCVRKVEYILADYSYFSRKFRDDGEKFLMARNEENDRLLAQVLSAVIAEGKFVSELPVGLSKGFHDALTLRAFPKSELLPIAGGISGIPPQILASAIEAEKADPGRAVNNDCRLFDVVPFADSRQMRCLYQMGTGFIVELLANFDEPDPMRMAAYVMHTLLHLSTSQDKSPLKVLALGDGLGIDSMRISALGCDVDYVDFEDSLTAKVANKLFEHWGVVKPSEAGAIRAVKPPIQNDTYDVVLCLEVIEHVDDIKSFLDTVSHSLKENGTLVISECFWGILPRWPTHIAKHRTLSPLLPILCSEHGLEFVASNKFPFGKPFLFKKSACARGFSAIDEITWSLLLSEQVRLRG